MIKEITKSVVFPVVPAYTEKQDLDFHSTLNYVAHLENDGAEILMTTAGTTQFHLLTDKEILKLNKACAEAFSGVVIAGLKPNSFLETKRQIKEHNDEIKNKNVCLMLLYPERYYDDESIVKYFHDLADVSNFPVLIHGMFMRKGTGGTYNFSASLVNKIAKHPKIIGMKEETNNLMEAYKFCKDVETENFGIIVAGGSQKRVSLLNSVGAQTFLSGVGSLKPSLDNQYHSCLVKGEYNEANKVKSNFEDKLFDVFMKFGWHLSLRTALKELKIITDHDRLPFVQPTQKQKEEIRKVISEIME